MAIERITDDNYQEFKASGRAVLVASTTWCKICKEYKPVITALSDGMPFVRFGEAVLDEGRLTQFKKEYANNFGRLPLTLLMKEGKEVGRIVDGTQYPTALKKITDALIIGSAVYLPNNGGYVPATIKSIINDKYILQLANNERKEAVEENFKWTLEGKL